MPNAAFSNPMKNSAAIAAMLFLAPNISASSAEPIEPLPYIADAPIQSSWTALPEFESTRFSQLPHSKKAIAQLPPLTTLGLKLLELRRAAIAAGMQTLSSEKIMEEFRMAREA